MIIYIEFCKWSKQKTKEVKNINKQIHTQVMPAYLSIELKFCYGVTVDAAAHFEEPVTERLICLRPQASSTHCYYPISVSLADGLVLTKPTCLREE